MFLPLSARLSPSLRGQLFLAAVPLACIVIGRALAELEELLASKVTELASLESRIGSRRSQLEVLVLRVPDEAPTESPAPFNGTPRTICIHPSCDHGVTDGWLCTEHTSAHEAANPMAE